MGAVLSDGERRQPPVAEMYHFYGGGKSGILLFLIQEEVADMEMKERLQTLRKKSGLSQEKLAETLHVTRQAVSKWETGQSSPDLDNIVAMCELYQVSADYILLGREPETEKTVLSEKSRLPVFCILTGAGFVLICLLPLFAKLYQGYEFDRWSRANTYAVRYIIEFPILGIFLIAIGFLCIGIAGVVYQIKKR